MLDGGQVLILLEPSWSHSPGLGPLGEPHCCAEKRVVPTSTSILPFHCFWNGILC